MAIKRVLITEKVRDTGILLLEDEGYAVDVRLNLSHDDLVRIIPKYNALIVRQSTKVTREVIEAGAQLKVIGRAGVGVDNIDLAAATEKGVVVCNAPTSNIVSAAEQTMALLLSCARNIPQANASMHAGQWNRAAFVGTELYEKTLAIFGLGRVGSLVAERARAFGMKLVAYDPYCSFERAEQLGVTLYDNVHDVLPRADMITIHLPLTSETSDMFGPNEFAEMKDGVIIINCARAGILNLKSLGDFIAAGKVMAAGVDMHDSEPCTDGPLHEFSEAILTPRLGSATWEAQNRASAEIARSVIAALSGAVVPNALNMTPITPESFDLVGPFVPACQSMGRVLVQMLGGIPHDLKLTTAGSLAHADDSSLKAAAVSGMFSMSSYASVTAQNVESVARRHGVHVESASLNDASGFESYVSIEADGFEIGATLIGRNSSMRIISLLGYQLEISPAGRALVFEYVDAPGRIGTIGTILGEAGVNITTMQIATKPEEQCALVYMNVEGEVNEDVVARLHEAIPLKNLWSLSF